MTNWNPRAHSIHFALRQVEADSALDILVGKLYTLKTELGRKKEPSASHLTVLVRDF